jgi:hypothetical protein
LLLGNPTDMLSDGQVVLPQSECVFRSADDRIVFKVFVQRSKRKDGMANPYIDLDTLHDDDSPKGVFTKAGEPNACSTIIEFKSAPFIVCPHEEGYGRVHAWNCVYVASARLAISWACSTSGGTSIASWLGLIALDATNYIYVTVRLGLARFN